MNPLTASAILSVVSVAAEEVFLRRSGFRLADLEISPAGLPRGVSGRQRVFHLRYRIIRIVQFAVFGSMWILAAARTDRAMVASPLGQLTTALLMLQVVRVLGRRILRSWALLTVTGLQQALQAALVPVLAGLHRGPFLVDHIPGQVYGMFLTTATAASGLAFSASVTYLLKLRPGRTPRILGEEPPPLAASEGIARRSVATALPLLSGALASGAVIVLTGGGAGALRLPAVALAALAAAILSFRSFRNRNLLHHPAGMTAALLPYVLLLAGIVSGLASVRP